MAADQFSEVERRYFNSQGDKEVKLKMWSLYFDLRSAELAEDAKHVLDLVVQEAALQATFKLQVQGFSDEIGDEESNRKVRFQRVNQVTRALIARGVPPSLISLLPWNGKYTGVPRFDRRVEIRILPK